MEDGNGPGQGVQSWMIRMQNAVPVTDSTGRPRSFGARDEGQYSPRRGSLSLARGRAALDPNQRAMGRDGCSKRAGMPTIPSCPISQASTSWRSPSVFAPLGSSQINVKKLRFWPRKWRMPVARHIVYRSLWRRESWLSLWRRPMIAPQSWRFSPTQMSTAGHDREGRPVLVDKCLVALLVAWMEKSMGGYAACGC